MADVNVAVRAYGRSPTEMDQVERRTRFLQLILYGTGLVGFIGQAVYLVANALRSGAWSFDRNTIQLVFGAAILTTVLPSLFSLFDAGQTQMLALRQAAADGDADLAPIAEEQPTPRATNESRAGPVVLGPLAKPGCDTSRSYVIFGGSFLGLSALTLLTIDLVLLMLFLSAPPETAVHVAASVLASTGGLIVFFVALTATFGASNLDLGRRTGGHIYAVADHRGIGWSRGPNGAEIGRIAWQDARAFTTFTWRGRKDFVFRKAYALDAGNAVLAWAISHDRNDHDSVATSDQLIRLIATYTSLPLRDITSASEQIGRAEPLRTASGAMLSPSPTGRPANALSLWVRGVSPHCSERAPHDIGLGPPVAPGTPLSGAAPLDRLTSGPWLSR
jgi:hypothetical protein